MSRGAPKTNRRRPHDLTSTCDHTCICVTIMKMEMEMKMHGRRNGERVMHGIIDTYVRFCLLFHGKTDRDLHMHVPRNVRHIFFVLVRQIKSGSDVASDDRPGGQCARRTAFETSIEIEVTGWLFRS